MVGSSFRATAVGKDRNRSLAAALAAVGVKPEKFSDTLASCDSSTGHIVTGQTGTLEVVKTALNNVRFGSLADIAAAFLHVRFAPESGRRLTAS